MQKQQKKIIFAGVLGNAIEWYDFTVYAFFAPVIAKLYFPNADPVISLLLTFSVFAAGFLVRPLGGVFIGYIGDHFGRKKALILSISLMSIPTLLLGFLPTYQAIGLAAPLLLILLRLVQGIAVSGELTSAAAFLIEHAKEKWRGLAGSYVLLSAFIGVIFSSALASGVTHYFTPEQVSDYGFRLPFILGGLVGMFGLWLRLRTQETDLFIERSKEKLPSFINHLFSIGFKPILLTTLLTCVMAIGNYFLIAYFNTFLVNQMGFALKDASWINLIALCVFALCLPLMGALSDKIGRKPTLLLGTLGSIVCIYPVFWLLQQRDIHLALWGEILFAVMLSPITATIATTISELFHVGVRNSGISIGYNVSLALFGGTAPLISIALVSATQSLYAPAWYLIAGAAISLFALLFIQESYQSELR
jgi:proline/betaine transport protein TphA